MNIEFKKSPKGHNILLVDGYIYYRNGSYNGKVYWKCGFYRTKKCSSRVKTRDSQVISITSHKNHENLNITNGSSFKPTSGAIQFDKRKSEFAENLIELANHVNNFENLKDDNYNESQSENSSFQCSEEEKSNDIYKNSENKDFYLLKSKSYESQSVNSSFQDNDEEKSNDISRSSKNEDIHSSESSSFKDSEDEELNHSKYTEDEKSNDIPKSSKNEDILSSESITSFKDSEDEELNHSKYTEESNDILRNSENEDFHSSESNSFKDSEDEELNRSKYTPFKYYKGKESNASDSSSNEFSGKEEEEEEEETFYNKKRKKIYYEVEPGDDPNPLVDRLRVVYRNMRYSEEMYSIIRALKKAHYIY